jgi:hypothetical protein
MLPFFGIGKNCLCFSSQQATLKNAFQMTRYNFHPKNQIKSNQTSSISEREV